MNNSPLTLARTLLALAAAAALTGAPGAAQALGLGRLHVNSALGEGMRAEIDITTLTPEELASLQVRIAPPEAYRAAGVDYNAVLSSTQAILARRGDGRHYVRVVSDRAVQEPFVEVILELTWSTGRLVREFTLLFDPPGNRAAPPVQAAAPLPPALGAAPTAPQAAPAAPPPVAQAPRPPRPAPAPAPSREPAPPPERVAERAPERPVPAPRAPVAPTAGSEANITVRPGDSLSGVAARVRRPGVSLDQMLVGLFRANPDAFFAHNMNRLRAGAVLNVPATDELRGISNAEARQVIVAQSADFGGYRNRLAQNVPQAPAPAADSARQDKGRVQTAVADRKADAAPTPDKLKLSAGTPGKPGTPEAQVSQQTERKDAATRVAELNRNLDELNKLSRGTAAVAQPASAAKPAMPVPTPAPAPVPAAAASVAAKPPVAAPTPAPAPLPAPAPAPLAVASAAAPAASVIAPSPLPVPVAAAPSSAPVAVAGGLPAASAAAARPRAVPPPPKIEEPSFLDSLSGTPFLFPALGLAGAGLLGLVGWRLRDRFKKAPAETSFLESRMQPDSFFGASGGQRVDTRDAGGQSSSSSMGYSLSQLDAIGDVDPVAEADVYLAYGRDLQAEEILKEAMRATPDRMAVRTKLLEVYAKRRDTKGFELLATQLYSLTKGQGADWAKAQELGRTIDPENPLYQPGGHPEEIVLDGERVVVEPLSATTMPASILTQTRPDSGFGPDSEPVDLDLDLEVTPDQPTEPARLMDATRPLAAQASRDPVDRGLDMDFADLTPPPLPAAGRADRRLEPGLGDGGPDSMSLDFDDEPSTTVSVPRNLGDTQLGLTTDFDPSEPAPLDAGTSPGGLDEGDPLSRKLELADEFRQIGDAEGARDLLEEVISRASGPLKARAQAMLDALG